MVNYRLAFARGALALALMSGAMDSARAQRVEQGVDTSVAPGDDFFAFANGAWLERTVIPEGRERWGVRNEIDELARRQVAALLDGAGTAPRGSAARPGWTRRQSKPAALPHSGRLSTASIGCVTRLR